MNFGGGAFAMPAQQQQQQQGMSNAGLSSKFSQLPTDLQEQIKRIDTEFRRPMRAGLDSIQIYDKQGESKVFNEMNDTLRHTKLKIVRLENRQKLMQEDVDSLLEESRDLLNAARRHGKQGLMQVVKGRSQYSDSYTEDLPHSFYVGVLAKLEKRMQDIVEEIMQFSQQLSATVDSFAGSDDYGYSMGARSEYIGPRQLVQLLQQQNETFGKLASSVALVHQETEALRQYYLNHICRVENPFERADREEKAKAKRITERAREHTEDQQRKAHDQLEAMLKSADPKKQEQFQQQQQQQQNQQQQTGNQPFGATGSGIFGTAPAAGSMFGAGGGGMFGAPPAANVFGSAAGGGAGGMFGTAPAFGATGSTFGSSSTTSTGPAAQQPFGAGGFSFGGGTHSFAAGDLASSNKSKKKGNK